MRRIDIARDFIVSDAARCSLLTGLSRLDIRYATKRSMWVDSHGQPRSLYVGTGHEGLVKAYDHHHRHQVSPRQTLRVEVQAYRRWARRCGSISTVGDLSPSSVTDLYLNRFHWARMGTAVVHPHARLEAIWALVEDSSSNLTGRKATGFVGGEAFRQAGIEVTEGHTTASTRNMLRAALGTAHDDYEGPTYIHLDPAHDEALRCPS